MQRTPGKTLAAREKYWIKIIEAARHYPDGITAYCRFTNVSKNNYYQWFKRLRSRHPEWHDLTNHPEILLSSQKKKVSEEANRTPDTEVVLNARRRKWSLSDKARILQETDECEPGQLGAILRREGLYVHNLHKWRTARDLLEIVQQKKQRGPRPVPDAPESKKLKEEISRLAKKLRQATEIIKLQKKISGMMEDLDLNDS